MTGTPIRVLVIGSEDLSAAVTASLDGTADIESLGLCTCLSTAKSQLAQLMPDIALIDLGLSGSLGLLEGMMQDQPATAAIVLLAEAQMGLLQRAMLVGAWGFSLLPIKAEDLRATLRQVHAAEQKRRSQSGGEQGVAGQRGHTPAGKVVAISGLKGGVGRTVIAVNLAVVLAEQSPGKAALMEGSAGFGDAALLLNAQPLHSLVDVATDPSRLDADLMRGALLRHASGLQVLFGAKSVEEAALLTPALLAAALTQLRLMANFVVVDTGAEAGESLGVLLAVADVVMLVTTPELPALRRAALLLRETHAEGFPAEKVRLVINREGISGGFSTADIAQRLGLQPAVVLPDDPGLVAFSVNRGVPLVQSHPKSLLARRLQELASEYIGKSGEGRLREVQESPERSSRLRLSRPMRVKEAW